MPLLFVFTEMNYVVSSTVDEREDNSCM